MHGVTMKIILFVISLTNRVISMHGKSVSPNIAQDTQ